MFQKEKSNRKFNKSKPKEQLLNIELKKIKDMVWYAKCDENNVIVVTSLPYDKIKELSETKKRACNYTMSHYRLNKIEGLQKIKSWPVRNFYYDSNTHKILPEEGLFLVQDRNSTPSYVYNYKEAKFIVPYGMVDEIESKYLGSIKDANENIYYYGQIDLLKEYGVIVGKFQLSTQYESSDYVKYNNLVTNEEMTISFVKKSPIYHVFINRDGSIHDNKIFVGNSLSEIEQIVDLTPYHDLQNFKKTIISQLELEKKQAKENYFEELNKSKTKYLSPYQDEKVLKILKKDLRKN